MTFRAAVAAAVALVALVVAGVAMPSSGGTQAKSLVEAGGYVGVNPQGGGYPISFFVSANRTSLLTIAIPEVSVTCATGSTNVPSFSILRAAIRRDGSFAAKGSQTGAFGNDATAKFTYAFTGRFERTAATAAAMAGGTFREDIAYTTGTTKGTCSSNNVGWTVTHGSQAPQQKYVVSPGNYTGINPQGGGYHITFSVSADRKNLLTIAIPEVSVTCATGSTNVPSFSILRGAIKPDGSFAAKGSQTGVFGTDTNAKFTYAFTGDFEGTDATGAALAVGTFREDIGYNNGTATVPCSSNNVAWTATR
jgi:hypothetical protein